MNAKFSKFKFGFNGMFNGSARIFDKLTGLRSNTGFRRREEGV